MQRLALLAAFVAAIGAAIFAYPAGQKRIGLLLRGAPPVLDSDGIATTGLDKLKAATKHDAAAAPVPASRPEAVTPPPPPPVPKVMATVRQELNSESPTAPKEVQTEAQGRVDKLAERLTDPATAAPPRAIPATPAETLPARISLGVPPLAGGTAQASTPAASAPVAAASQSVAKSTAAAPIAAQVPAHHEAKRRLIARANAPRTTLPDYGAVVRKAPSAFNRLEGQ